MTKNITNVENVENVEKVENVENTENKTKATKPTLINEVREFRLIRELQEKGNGEVFDKYKFINEKGKKIDARMKLDVDLSLFADGTKFIVKAHVQESNAYEYPRVYISAVESVEKLY